MKISIWNKKQCGIVRRRFNKKIIKDLGTDTRKRRFNKRSWDKSKNAIINECKNMQKERNKIWKKYICFINLWRARKMQVQDNILRFKCNTWKRGHVQHITAEEMEQHTTTYLEMLKSGQTKNTDKRSELSLSIRSNISLTCKIRIAQHTFEKEILQFRCQNRRNILSSHEATYQCGAVRDKLRHPLNMNLYNSQYVQATAIYTDAVMIWSCLR